MKYFAAVVSDKQIEAVTVFPPYCILCSYHYFKNKQELVKKSLESYFDVFVDSGAFSADKSGKEIKIDDYCKFILDTGVITYAGLDVIGNPKKTMENIKYMQSEYDLKPIPTFHLGSSLADLESIMDYPYIAMGGLVASPGVRQHLNKSWDFILRNNPKLRVHGFGVTNLDIMKDYPWYSVDSSTFKMCAMFGNQSILFNGMQIETMREDEYLTYLEKSGYKDVRTYSNYEKYHLYMLYSSQSFKMYAAHLGELRKYRTFEYLTAQQNLF